MKACIYLIVRDHILNKMPLSFKNSRIINQINNITIEGENDNNIASINSYLLYQENDINIRIFLVQL